MKKNWLLILLGTLVVNVSCKKDDKTTANNNNSNNLGALNATWYNSAWGGVNGDTIKFQVSSAAATGLITQIGNPAFGFSVNDPLFSNITSTGTGTYSCTGQYRYGATFETLGTRNATMLLTNNNTQLVVDYPALNTSFPEITYTYQKQ